MIASWKLWFGLVFICSQQCRVETQKLQVEPLDLAALRGSDVQFIANVEGTWDVMTWKVGKLLVLTIADDIIGSGRFNASFCYNDSRRCVEFKIYDVSHEDSGAVEFPKPADWTVLIAVVVSFGSCALLVLLILGIYHCYKQRKEKESNYQDEMRRVKTQSQLSVISADEQTSGQVNETYEPDNQDINIHVGAEPGFVKHRHVTIV
ncbi:PREDICTED: uncharacterized protein LOC107101523 [Cyprinodon variegatus]|uniref:uncharacterized protein LOC107101523 n=1 Tax=Cyprinodon variegatus TaxID=28743 RepID=UPI000742AB53|nr:PREDICTED: uncharacterized protein LOC107101523 [Cyprinodon variegatus]